MKHYRDENGVGHYVKETLCAAAVQYRNGKVCKLNEFGWRKELRASQKVSAKGGEKSRKATISIR